MAALRSTLAQRRRTRRSSGLLSAAAEPRGTYVPAGDIQLGSGGQADVIARELTPRAKMAADAM